MIIGLPHLSKMVALGAKEVEAVVQGKHSGLRMKLAGHTHLVVTNGHPLQGYAWLERSLVEIYVQKKDGAS